MNLLKTIFCIVLFAVRANALIVSGTGQPALSGCPAGAAAACSNAVAWWEGPPFGGGEWHVLFRGDAEKLSAVLTHFAAIRSPDLEVVLHAGPKFDPILEVDRNEHTNTDSRLDWELVVWNQQSWKNLYGSTNAAWRQLLQDNPGFQPPAAAPRLHVYLGGGMVDWAKVRMPANIRLRDGRKNNSTEPAK